ncbi:MAG: hypothetical protein IPK33_24190 [Gemmatimonadetes bacterium]|nr:hypothetical protein [Gemmatimonadota bacterium]
MGALKREPGSRLGKGILKDASPRCGPYPFFNTSAAMDSAFCISSIVPIESRMCVVSGGKARPTATPRSRIAARNAIGSRRMSVRKKFACEGTTENPSSRIAFIEKVRTCVLSAF